MSYFHGFRVSKFPAEELSFLPTWIALLPACVCLYLLPCITDTLGIMLLVLGWHIEEAANNARAYGYNRFSVAIRDATKPTRPKCSVLFNDPTPVYLMASTISFSSSNNSYTLNSRSSETMRQQELPMAELVGRFPRTTRDDTYRMHWAVVIRGMMYELDRVNGSRSVSLRVTPPGSHSRVDAFGIPLRLAWVEEIGITYLKPEEIETLAQKAVSRAKYYNPFTHNCQRIWPDELFPRIVCQCPERKLLEIPSELLDFAERITMLVTAANLAAAVVSVLLDNGVIPFTLGLCSKSSKWGFVATEVSKYFTAARLLHRNPTSYLMDRGVLIPYIDFEPVQQLEAARDGDEFYNLDFDPIIEEFEKVRNDPDTLRLYTHFSRSIVSLFRFLIIFTLPSTVISYMYRFSTSFPFQALYIVSLVLVTFQAWRAWRLRDLPQFPVHRDCEAQVYKVKA